MPMPQTPDAISKGVVDGYVLPWEVVPTMKLHEMTKYHSEINPPQPGLYTTLFTIAMNQAKYDSLTPEQKKVIDANSGVDFSAAIGKAWDESAPRRPQAGARPGQPVQHHRRGRGRGLPESRGPCGHRLGQRSHSQGLPTARPCCTMPNPVGPIRQIKNNSFYRLNLLIFSMFLI